MKAFLGALVLFLVCLSIFTGCKTTVAQISIPSNAWQVVGELNPKTGKWEYNGGGRIKYQQGTSEATELISDQATLNPKSGDVVATGNVELRRDGKVWTAKRMVYNFQTKIIQNDQETILDDRWRRRFR
jgi:lipopolysaccharide assembly outer membrane protein LptD (OstA)